MSAGPENTDPKGTAKWTKGGPSPNPKGRPRGKSHTTLIREAALEAAERAGGKQGMVGYLERIANEQPNSFMALLGKILPTQLQHSGEDGGPVRHVVATAPLTAEEWARKHGGDADGA